MKHSALSLAISSRLGDAMVGIAGDVARSHDVGALLVAARHGDRTVQTMTGVMARAARADEALANAYQTRAGAVLPTESAVGEPAAI